MNKNIYITSLLKTLTKLASYKKKSKTIDEHLFESTDIGHTTNFRFHKQETVVNWNKKFVG